MTKFPYDHFFRSCFEIYCCYNCRNKSFWEKYCQWNVGRSIYTFCKIWHFKTKKNGLHITKLYSFKMLSSKRGENYLGKNLLNIKFSYRFWSFPLFPLILISMYSPCLILNLISAVGLKFPFNRLNWFVRICCNIAENSTFWINLKIEALFTK